MIEVFEFFIGVRIYFWWLFSDGLELLEVEFNCEISFREDKVEVCDLVEGNDDIVFLEDGLCFLNFLLLVLNIGEGLEK